MSLTLDTPVTLIDDLLSSTLGDEKIILDLTTGTYYGLDGVGARVWGLLEESRTGREICNQLEAEYDVDRSTLETDVLRLLRRFEDEGFLQRSPQSEREEAT